MSCCETGSKLRGEYDNALKFEALAYGRVIAHKRRHEKVSEISNVRYMRLVREAAERYTEGDVDPHAEIPPA